MSHHTPQISQKLTPEPDQDEHQVHEVQCPDCDVCTKENRILPGDLEAFTAGILERHGVSAAEARITARVLVAADVRGIPSHGVARLGRYLTGIDRGYIVPGAPYDIQEPAPAVAVIDAKNGLGQVVAERAMDLALDKAAANGIGVVTVKHSNHYGIAGYYALKAVSRRMIGVSMTNSAPLVVPTHGAEVVLGTNPIAFGAPTHRHPPFLLDMATSVVPRGKLEVYDRNAQQMPVGWTVDEHGYDAQNPAHVLKNLTERIGGGILPLGGRGELYSGHKGYGLAFMVDILTGVLSGAAYGPDVHNLGRSMPPGQRATPDVGHFFGAMDITRFMPIEDFEARLDDLIDRLKQSKKALDREAIFFHGEQAWARTRDHEEQGIPMAENVMCALVDIAKACDHPPPEVQPDRQAA